MAPTYPRSTAVFDVDSVDMVRLTHSRLNAGADFGGRLGDRRGAADQARVGAEIAAEQIRRRRAEGWSGVYLMSPAGPAPVPSLEVLAAGLG